MILERFKNIEIFKEKNYAVIGIVLGDSVRYEVLLISKNKVNLSISKSFSTQDLDNLKKELPAKVPLILNFSGKGIINKKVGAKDNYIKEVLFNANLEDFYIYTATSKAHNFVSVCRKNIVDEQINEFRKIGHHIIDYSIGPFVAISSIGIMKESVLSLENEEVVFANGSIVDYRRISNKSTDYKYCVGNDLLKGKEVVLLSSLLNNLYPSGAIEYDKGFLLENQKNYRLKKVFDFFAVASMVTVLTLLLCSYLLLNYFNNKYIEYEEQLYHFNDNYHKIKQMEEDLMNKQFMVENSGVLKGQFLSFYINELIGSLPGEITLSGLEVNPLEKKVKINEPISIQSDIVVITGETSHSIYVHRWVNKISEEPWVDKVEILSLNRVDKNTGAFSLKIEIL